MCLIYLRGFSGHNVQQQQVKLIFITALFALKDCLLSTVRTPTHKFSVTRVMSLSHRDAIPTPLFVTTMTTTGCVENLRIGSSLYNRHFVNTSQRVIEEECIVTHGNFTT